MNVFPARSACLQDFLALGGDERHRFLAEHMLAPGERRQDHLAMHLRRQADVDRVDRGVVDQRAPVRHPGDVGRQRTALELQVAAWRGVSRRPGARGHTGDRHAFNPAHGRKVRRAHKAITKQADLHPGLSHR